MPLQFTLSIEVLDFDGQTYNAAVAKRVAQHFKVAARKFYIEAMKRIPYYNSITRHSDISTGFVAGAFNNLRDTLGDKNFGATPPPLVPKDFEEQGFTKREAREVKELETEFLRFAKLKREYFESTNKPGGRSIPQIDIKLGVEAAKINNKKELLNLESHRLNIGGKKYKVQKTPQAGRGFSTQPEQIFSESVKIEQINLRKGQVSGPNKFSFFYSISINYFIWQELGLLSQRGRSPYAPWLALEAGKQAFISYLGDKKLRLDIFPDINEFFVRTKIKVDKLGKINIEKKDFQIVERPPPEGYNQPLPPPPTSGPGRGGPGLGEGRRVSPLGIKDPGNIFKPSPEGGKYFGKKYKEIHEAVARQRRLILNRPPESFKEEFKRRFRNLFNKRS